MIRKVHFQNFRCLRDVELSLEPLTVIVGPNASGKTTVLAGLQPRKFVASDAWKQVPQTTVKIRWTYDNGHSFTTLGQPPGYTDGGSETQLQSPWKSPHIQQFLSLDLAALRRENTLAAASYLETSGGNLTNVFASLTRSQQSAVARDLCRLVPMFSDVDLQPTDSGKHRLRFRDRWESNLWFAPAQVSDGTMLVLAFLVLQYQAPPVDLITIEEPERALHPYLLEEVIRLMRRMATGEIGTKAVQIVLATHSAEFLEYVRPEEVRFLSRSPEDGSVQVNQADTTSPNWQRAYKEYQQSLGGIWLSGSMGGVPGA